MNPRTVEKVTTDFKGRRAGIIKALTKDFENVYNLCDPKHPSLCLYGLPSQRWEVKPPPSPSLSPRLRSFEIPKPQLGINLVRDDMTKGEWLHMVALHCDAWLYSVASYFCSKNKFNKIDRKRVFNKIFDVDSVSEFIARKTIRKRIKVNGLPPHLPEEILEEVLARLPVKDLLRYRSVCKKWCRLIDDPSFVNTHMGSYQSNIVGDRLFFSEEHSNMTWSSSKWIEVRYNDTFKKAMKLKNIVGQYRVLGNVNGLVLILQYSSPNLILWNPSINKFKVIFNAAMIHPTAKLSYYVFGLGFDASTNDYKVVLFTYTDYKSPYYFTRDTDHDVRYRGIELTKVYSLSTNCWTTKNGVNTPPHWKVGPQVYFNGAIHWMGFGPNVTDDSWESFSNCSHIVSFDVGNEVFNYSELPIDIVKSFNKNTFMTAMDDCLAILCVCDCLHDIWVMKECGNSNSWSKCYTFSLGYREGLYFKRTGEFYVVDDVSIKSYDVKRNCARDLGITYEDRSSYTIFTFVESLVMSTLSGEPTVK